MYQMKIKHRLSLEVAGEGSIRFLLVVNAKKALTKKWSPNYQKQEFDKDITQCSLVGGAKDALYEEVTKHRIYYILPALSLWV